MFKRPLVLLAALVLPCAVLAAGCGSDSATIGDTDGGGMGTTDGATPEGATPADSAQPADSSAADSGDAGTMADAVAESGADAAGPPTAPFNGMFNGDVQANRARRKFLVRRRQLHGRANRPRAETYNGVPVNRIVKLDDGVTTIATSYTSVFVGGGFTTYRGVRQLSGQGRRDYRRPAVAGALGRRRAGTRGVRHDDRVVLLVLCLRRVARRATPAFRRFTRHRARTGVSPARAHVLRREGGPARSQPRSPPYFSRCDGVSATVGAFARARLPAVSDNGDPLNKTERRTHVRMKPTPDLPARATLLGDGVVREALDVVDLSVGGLALSSHALRTLRPGQRVKLHVTFGIGEEHGVEVQIRWTSGDTVGAELVDMPPHTAQALRRYIAELLERGE